MPWRPRCGETPAPTVILGSRTNSAIRAEMNRLEGQIAELIEHIQRQGVEVKDIRRGLVDWRAERDGRVVYLCWQYGEHTVSWWHELADGFAGRQPIVVSEWA